MTWDYKTAIAIDFDGTLTDDRTDTILSERLEDCIDLQKMGAVIILWTCRTGTLLSDAVIRLREAGLFPDYINEYPIRDSGHKVNADFYLDDKANNGLDWDKTIAVIKKKLRE